MMIHLKKYLTVLQISFYVLKLISILIVTISVCFRIKEEEKEVVYYCYGELSKQFPVVTTVARNIETILVFQFVGGSDQIPGYQNTI